MRKILSRKYFERKTLIIAKDLIGKFLVKRLTNNQEATLMITETEGYDGPHDKASHAHRGKTQRNAPMFNEAGRWYVYLIYGMCNMLNIVTGPRDYPAAILIRGVHHLESKTPSRLDGPGKLTKFLKIDKRFNDKLAKPLTGLWIEDRGIKIPKENIKITPRIGVSYAGPVWSKKPYRFVLENTEHRLEK